MHNSSHLSNERSSYIYRTCTVTKMRRGELPGWLRRFDVSRICIDAS